MAGKVFFSVTMSLDGFVAPEVDLGLSDGAQHMDDPDARRGLAQWMELQQWVFGQRFFRENVGLGEGGEEGRDNDILRATFERTGASVMGKRMFDLGEQAWPEDAPFHTPVFVVTHEKRDPWARPRSGPHRSRSRPARWRGCGSVCVSYACLWVGCLKC